MSEFTKSPVRKVKRFRYWFDETFKRYTKTIGWNAYIMQQVYKYFPNGTKFTANDLALKLESNNSDESIPSKFRKVFIEWEFDPDDNVDDDSNVVKHFVHVLTQTHHLPYLVKKGFLVRELVDIVIMTHWPKKRKEREIATFVPKLTKRRKEKQPTKAALKDNEYAETKRFNDEMRERYKISREELNEFKALFAINY